MEKKWSVVFTIIIASPFLSGFSQWFMAATQEILVVFTAYLLLLPVSASRFRKTGQLKIHPTLQSIPYFCSLEY